MFALILAGDSFAFSLINGLSGKEAIFDRFMLLLSSEYFLLAISLAVLGIFFFLQRKKFVAFLICLLVTVSLSDIFAYRFFKPLFARLRPCHQFKDANIVGDGCGSLYGFPSNHASNIMVFVALSILLARDRRRFLLLILVLAVDFSRVYLGVHFPLDVFFGNILGLILAVLSAKFLFTPIFARKD